jgi:hypothetical protein
MTGVSSGSYNTPFSMISRDSDRRDLPRLGGGAFFAGVVSTVFSSASGRPDPGPVVGASFGSGGLRSK